MFTTGGTGLSPDDVTPEATRAVIERDAPGFAEAMRAEALRAHAASGMLTPRRVRRRGADLIVNFPGSPGRSTRTSPSWRRRWRVVRTLRGDRAMASADGSPAVEIAGLGRALRRAGRAERRHPRAAARRDARRPRAPTAPASPRCCAILATLLRPHAGGVSVLGRALPARRAGRCAGGSASWATTRCSTAT